MGRQETGCEGMNWINLAQGRNKWRAPIETVTEVCVE
jgi:hypothetical protein